MLLLLHQSPTPQQEVRQVVKLLCGPGLLQKEPSQDRVPQPQKVPPGGLPPQQKPPLAHLLFHGDPPLAKPLAALQGTGSQSPLPPLTAWPWDWQRRPQASALCKSPLPGPHKQEAALPLLACHRKVLLTALHPPQVPTALLLPWLELRAREGRTAIPAPWLRLLLHLTFPLAEGRMGREWEWEHCTCSQALLLLQTSPMQPVPFPGTCL